MNVAKTMENLKKRGFTVSYFDTAAQAADYLDRSIDSQSVGVGGSVTLRDMGVYEKLAAHNEVFWQWYAPKGTSQEETYRKAERPIMTPPCGAPAISPAPKTPSVCKKRPPAPYTATNATIVPALIASAVAW